MTLNTLVFHGDNVAVVPTLPAFHCVVTSPPYKTQDGYSTSALVALHKAIGAKLVPGGWYFLNFAQLREDLSRSFELQQALAHCKDSGLVPGQTFIWAKSVVVDGVQRGHFQPLSSPTLLNYCWEFVFSFYKPLPNGKEPPLDRLAVGVPYADESNLTRGTRGKNGNIHCAGDVWFLPYETTGQTKKKKHEYEFPEALVERCIKLAGLKPGDSVLDPFGGSGPVGRVANRLGFNALLIDRNPEKVAGCVERGAVQQKLEANQ